MFLSTGAEAEAPAYYLSASPRRRRFYLPRVRVPAVSVLKALTHTGVLARQIAENGLEIGQTPAAGSEIRPYPSVLSPK